MCAEPELFVPFELRTPGGIRFLYLNTLWSSYLLLILLLLYRSTVSSSKIMGVQMHTKYMWPMYVHKY
eukprot:SAG31_NODE_36021_length_317_cov_0.926606_1_plen_67_part_10